MNELKIFNNPEFGQIRTIIKDDEVWFVGKDVASALGYKDTINALKAHIEIEDKDRWQITTQFGKKDTTIINESGLYSLALSSHLPKAKEFKRWITKDVIPSIRKYGAYLTPAKIEEVLLNPDTIIKLATELKQEREAKQKALLALEQTQQELEEAKPKLTYYDKILNSVGTMTSTQVGADYGISAIRLNRILSQEKLIRKVNGQWVLYQKYQNQGLTESKTFDVENDGEVQSYVQTKWTQKGRLKIHEILTNLGYIANYDKNFNVPNKHNKLMAQQKARKLVQTVA